MLPEIKKILYTTNLGEGTRPVAQFAVSLAKKLDAELYLLHVVEPLSKSDSFLVEAYLSEDTKHDTEKLMAKMREDASKQVLEKIRNRVERLCVEDFDATPEQRQKFMDDIRVVSGPPAETIVKEADELDVDLIIIGAHAGFSLKRAFLGSTARRVTHLSRKPVLVVPMAETETWS